MSRTEDSLKRERQRWLTPKAIRIVFGTYVLVLLLYGWTVWKLMGNQDAGLLGDTFGAFNAFVSGLAMLGVVAAIFLQKDQIEMQATELRLQRKELELQRRELELTRGELGLAAEAQQEQASLMHKAAYLNGLSTIVESYTAFLAASRRPPDGSNTEADLGDMLKRLRQEIEAMP